jgi:hypothetical protein
LASTVSIIDGVDDDRAVQQAGQGHLFDFSVALDFRESLDRFLTYLVNPTSRPRSELRMVFRFPCACRGTQRLPLTNEFNFSLGQLHQYRLLYSSL